MEKIRVMVVDDQELIRESLEMVLSMYPEIELIGMANSGQDVLNKISSLQPHVILMDIRMPVMDGVTATKLIKKRDPQIKIIILTTFNEDEYIFDALNYGADGYLLKDVKSEEIVKGIKTVYHGGTLLEPKVAAKVVRKFKDLTNCAPDSPQKTGQLAELTERERDVANLVGEGMSNKEISATLFITEGTVKNHLTKIMSKLEVRDRVQLALLMAKMNKT